MGTKASLIILIICIAVLGNVEGQSSRPMYAEYAPEYAPEYVSDASLLLYRESPSIAQAESEPGTELTLVRSEIRSADSLASEFATLKQRDEKVALASQALENKGFIAQTQSENFFGIRETYEVRDKSTGVTQQETYNFLVQDYIHPSTDDLAAVAKITVVAGDQREDYTFNLIAPDGNFENAIEYRVAEIDRAAEIDRVVGFDRVAEIDRVVGIDRNLLLATDVASGMAVSEISQRDLSLVRGNLEVVRANSWWSCVRQGLGGCGSTCLQSLTQCIGGSWVAYIGCVAGKCGGCFVKRSVCCGCNCKWWCRWAVGCCRR